jgi:multiple sugar transport system substrate-binding protein
MRNKKLSRREFLRTGALAAGGAALAGAIPSALAAPPAQEGVTITFWAFWSQYQQVIDAVLEEMNAYIAPNTVEVTTGVNAEQAFLPAVAAGTPPDIGTGHHYVDYMSNAQVVPIDDLVAASDVVQKQFYAEANWNGTLWQGIQYGIPAIEGFFRRGLNYNSKLVEEAGLDPDNPPQTWSELLVWHEALTKFDDAGNLIQIGLDPWDAEGGVFATNDGSFHAESWGVTWWDRDTQTFYLNDPRMAEGFDTMNEFVKVIGPDNLSGFRAAEGQGNWGTAFEAGVQAMIIEGYWHPGETYNTKPEVGQYNRATWVPVPDSRRGTKIQFAGGHMVFLYKDAANPADVAFPVGEFLNTNVHFDAAFNLLGWLPGYIPYLETADASAYPGLDFYLKSITEATEMWGSNPVEIESYIGQQHAIIRERHFRGELTGQQAADELQSKAEQNWDESGFGNA